MTAESRDLIPSYDLRNWLRPLEDVLGVAVVKSTHEKLVAADIKGVFGSAVFEINQYRVGPYSVLFLIAQNGKSEQIVFSVTGGPLAFDGNKKTIQREFSITDAQIRLFPYEVQLIGPDLDNAQMQVSLGKNKVEISKISSSPHS